VDLANPVNPVEREDSVDWADPEEVEDPIELGARLDPVEEDLGNLDAELKPFEDMLLVALSNPLDWDRPGTLAALDLLNKVVLLALGKDDPLLTVGSRLEWDDPGAGTPFRFAGVANGTTCFRIGNTFFLLILMSLIGKSIPKSMNRFSCLAGLPNL
jgi:hypothetical protein